MSSSLVAEHQPPFLSLPPRPEYRRPRIPCVQRAQEAIKERKMRQKMQKERDAAELKRLKAEVCAAP